MITDLACFGLGCGLVNYNMPIAGGVLITIGVISIPYELYMHKLEAVEQRLDKPVKDIHEPGDEVGRNRDMYPHIWAAMPQKLKEM